MKKLLPIAFALFAFTMFSCASESSGSEGEGTDSTQTETKEAPKVKIPGVMMNEQQMYQFFPVGGFPGYKLDKPSGAKNEIQGSVYQTVRHNLTKGDVTMKVEIFDYLNAQDLLEIMLRPEGWEYQGYATDEMINSEDGKMRGARITDAEGNACQTRLILGDRFVVMVSGMGTTDSAESLKIAKMLRLSSMMAAN